MIAAIILLAFAIGFVAGSAWRAHRDFEDLQNAFDFWSETDSKERNDGKQR